MDFYLGWNLNSWDAVASLTRFLISDLHLKIRKSKLKSSKAVEFGAARSRSEPNNWIDILDISIFRALQDTQVRPTLPFQPLSLRLASSRAFILLAKRPISVNPWDGFHIITVTLSFRFLVCFSEGYFLNHADFPISSLWMLSPEPLSPRDSIIIPVVMSRKIQAKIFPRGLNRLEITNRSLFIQKKRFRSRH